MSSLDSMLIKQALASGKVVQRADDAPVVMRLRYIGSGTITSLTMTTATGFVIITSDGGTDTYTFANPHTTMGLLADAINGDGVFEAKLLDALRADTTSGSAFLENTTLTATTDENGVTCYDIHLDTSAKDYVTVCLSPFANFDAPEGHRVHVKEVSYYQDVNAASAASVLLYARKSGKNGRRHETERLLYSATSADITVTTINWASGEGFISGNVDDEIIFRVKDATSITDNAASYVRIVGLLE